MGLDGLVVRLVVCTQGGRVESMACDAAGASGGMMLPPPTSFTQIFRCSALSTHRWAENGAPYGRLWLSPGCEQRCAGSRRFDGVAAASTGGMGREGAAGAPNGLHSRFSHTALAVYLTSLFALCCIGYDSTHVSIHVLLGAADKPWWWAATCRRRRLLAVALPARPLLRPHHAIVLFVACHDRTSYNAPTSTRSGSTCQVCQGLLQGWSSELLGVLRL